MGQNTSVEKASSVGRFYAPNIIARMFRTFTLHMYWFALWTGIMHLVPRAINALGLFQAEGFAALGIIFGLLVLPYYFIKDFRNKTADTCRLYFRNFIVKAFFYSLIAAFLNEAFWAFLNPTMEYLIGVTK